MGKQEVEQRRHQRVVLTPAGAPPIEQAFAVLGLPAGGLRRQIHNISYRGVSILLTAGDEERLREQKNIPITLEMEGVLAKTAGTVTHVGDKTAGISFIALNDTSRRIISAYLDPRYLGGNLAEVSPRMLHDQHRRVFLGPNNTRLLLTMNPSGEQIVALEAYFLGRYLGVDPDGRVATGTVEPGTNAAGALPSDTEPEFLHDDQEVNRQTVETFLRLWRHVPIEPTVKLSAEVKLHLQEKGRA